MQRVRREMCNLKKKKERDKYTSECQRLCGDVKDVQRDAAHAATQSSARSLICLLACLLTLSRVQLLNCQIAHLPAGSLAQMLACSPAHGLTR